MSKVLVEYGAESVFSASGTQFSSVAQSCPTLCDPMNCSIPGLPVHHQLPEFTQTHLFNLYTEYIMRNAGLQEVKMRAY